MSANMNTFARAHARELVVATSALAAIAAIVVRSGSFSAAAARFAALFAPASTKTERPAFKEERCLVHVCKRAAEGNPQSVLNVIDDYCEKIERMMNVGPIKGAILKAEIAKKQPKVVVEFGSYVGYSAVLIAASLQEGSHLYSIDTDPLHSAISTKVAEFAGLKDRVTFLIGTPEDRLHTLQSKYNVNTIDLLFIDHHKAHYLKDFKHVEQMSFLKSGSVVIADNILRPGAPDYLEYVQNHPQYETKLHETELSSGLKDAVTVSIKK